MKKIVTISLATFLVSAVLFSCSKNSNDTIGEVSPIVVIGDWRVSLFSERGINETSDFAGYSFVFQNDGKLIVNKDGILQKEGTWLEDKSSHKLILNLGIKDNSNKPLGELTDDWFLTARTDTKISLTDDNASRNEILEFSRN